MFEFIKGLYKIMFTDTLSFKDANEILKGVLLDINNNLGSLKLVSEVDGKGYREYVYQTMYDNFLTLIEGKSNSIVYTGKSITDPSSKTKIMMSISSGTNIFGYGEAQYLVLLRVIHPTTGDVRYYSRHHTAKELLRMCSHETLMKYYADVGIPVAELAKKDVLVNAIDWLVKEIAKAQTN